MNSECNGGEDIGGVKAASEAAEDGRGGLWLSDYGCGEGGHEDEPETVTRT